MRVGIHDALGIGQANVGEHLDRTCRGLRLGDAFVDDRHFHELAADGEARIQRRHRLLVDH